MNRTQRIAYRSMTSLFSLMILLVTSPAYAEESPISLTVNGEAAETIEILFLLSIIALLPSILIMMTSFTRIIIVLSFLRTALGVQQAPPNQVLIGIALFLSLFIMNPVIEEIHQEAYIPYEEGLLTSEEALEEAQIPLKEFMLKQTKSTDLTLFMDLANTEEPEEIKDLGMEVIIPAFVTSELKQAFLMGFLLFIPFIVIDLVVASTLMSMGMIMLPPAMISMPFKLLLFVLVDGWGMLVETLVTSFR